MSFSNEFLVSLPPELMLILSYSRIPPAVISLLILIGFCPKLGAQEHGLEVDREGKREDCCPSEPAVETPGATSATAPPALVWANQHPVRGLQVACGFGQSNDLESTI